MQRIEYFSPVNFGKIVIGGISETKRGFWLPKIKTELGSYRNIKDGVWQLTRAQAISLLIRSYYERIGAKRGWTKQEIEEKLQQAHQLYLENQYQELAAEAQRLGQLENPRKSSDKNSLNVEILGIFHLYFQISKTTHLLSERVTYRVKLVKKKGWMKIRDFIFSLNLSQETQRHWEFESFGAATSFISFVISKFRQKP